MCVHRGEIGRGEKGARRRFPAFRALGRVVAFGHRPHDRKGAAVVAKVVAFAATTHAGKATATSRTRESEVLLWIARGKSNRDVAEILSLSPRTVNKHLEQIYAKLGVENRTAAAALAMRTLGLR